MSLIVHVVGGQGGSKATKLGGKFDLDLTGIPAALHLKTVKAECRKRFGKSPSQRQGGFLDAAAGKQAKAPFSDGMTLTW